MNGRTVDDPLEDLAHIDRLVDQFEDQWQAGSVPGIEDYLAQLPRASEAARRQLLIDLVVIDLANRRRRHDQPTTTPHGAPTTSDAKAEHALPERARVEDYLTAFPLLGGAGGVPIEVVVEEYYARRRCGERPAHDEYRERFPQLSSDLAGHLLSADQQLDERRPSDRPAGKEQAAETIVQTVRINADERRDAAVKPVRECPIRVFGDYEIVAEVARGGMGVVYLARQVTLNRSVALKMIKTGNLASSEEIQRFRAEAEAAAHLDHSNIVSVYEVGERDGQHFFSMAFVDGMSLAQRLRSGPLAPRAAAEMCRKVAAAIDYAHRNGVIHRDLKPSNILLDADGEPRITDFGLAKQVDSGYDLTVTGQILGTPGFMAPEQAEGRAETGPSIDVYAVGAVLYNALTGRPPFQADSPLDTMAQVVNQEPVSPRQLNAKVDRDLETICLRCLEKDAQRRYGTAAARAADLGRWLSGEPIEARPASRAERLVKWVRRRPAASAAIAASIAAIFALGAAISAAAYNSQLSRSLNESATARNQAETALGDLRVAKAETDAALDEAEEANQRAREADYYRRIALAQEEWQNGKCLAVSNLLYGSPEEFRGWEWRHLLNLTRQNVRGTRLGSGQDSDILPSGMACTPDGRFLFAAKHSGWIDVFDAASLELSSEWELGGPAPALGNRIAVSHDGRLLAALQLDVKRLQIWDVEERKLLHALGDGSDGDQAQDVSDMAFERESHRLIAAGRDRITWFDAERGAVLRTVDVPGAATRLDVHPDGSRLAVAILYGSLLIIDASDGRVIAPIQMADLTDTASSIQDVCYDPSGTQLALSVDHVVCLWDVASGKLAGRLEHGGLVRSMLYTPGGERIVTGCEDRMIRIWDRRTGTLLKTIRGHGAPITHLAMSPSGETVFSADVYGYVRSWELARDYGAFREFRVPFRCQDVAWIPHSGRLLVTGGRPIESGGPGPRIAILESASGESLEISDSGTVIMSSDVTGDGRRFVTGVWDGPLEIRDTATGGVVSRMQEKRSGLRRLSLSPDGQLAVAAHGGTVVMWDLERGMPKYERRIDGTIWHVAFHPSGRYFVSASGLSFVSASGRSPGTMRLIAWTADDGERLFDQVCDGRPQSLAFHPGGGQLAVGWIDATMELRSFPENERIRTFPGAQFHASTLDYSPDGTRLAAATRDGVGVWDVTTGQRALHLNHPLAVSAAFSPDGHKLATAASDGTIRIWDAIPMTQKMTE